MSKYIQASDAAKLLRPRMNVYIQANASEPKSIIKALKKNPNASKGIHYISVAFPGLNRTNFAGLHESTSMTCFFMQKDIKHSFSTGQVRFVPIHLNEIYHYLESEIELDFAIIQVSTPDHQGYCSLGVTADYVSAILKNAKKIIAEINPNMPRTSGEPPIHQSLFNYMIEVNYPLLEMPTGKITPEIQEISRYVSSLINDGDTLQFGVGSIPDAILYGLHNKRDLGIHSGMISDAVVDLVERGVVNGLKKSIDNGKIVTGAAIGSQRLYDFIHNNHLIDFRPINYTHSIEVLQRIDNLVSINSAIEIDLYGQVNAETMNGVQYGGTGGQGNFIRGANLSHGGKTIIAFLSSASNGGISRVVPTLKEGTIVTTPRTDVHYVVTEYGVANLKNKSLQERADELISISAPQFREELLSAWNTSKEKW